MGKNEMCPNDLANFNKRDVLESRNCGCFHCLKIFPSFEIRSWVHKRETALCPYCGINSVIGEKSINGVIEENFLILIREECYGHGYGS